MPQRNIWALSWYMAVLFLQYTENICFLSKFSAGGLCDWGILLVISLEFQGNKASIVFYDTDKILTIYHVTKRLFSIIQIILYLIPILFIVVFVGAYIQGLNIGEGIITYLIFAGGGALIGSLLSGSKIQSALVGMVVAPVTVIHPLLAAGWFSGLVEGKLRKVGFDDLAELADFESFKDLWHNKLFRVILVVLGTNIGCTIGFLITLNNVFVPYIHVIFGI